MKCIDSYSLEHHLESEIHFLDALELAERITTVHQGGGDPDQLEARVLELQFAQQFIGRVSENEFVGRVRYPLVGLSPEAMGFGFYCHKEGILRGLELYPAHLNRSKALLDYWAKNTTSVHLRDAYPDRLKALLPSDNWFSESGVAFPLYRMAGSVLNYPMLLELGLDGLENKTQATIFSHVVPLLRQTIDRYIELEGASSTIGKRLTNIRHAPPKTLHEAIQLFWLYALHSGTWNYGRLDDTLGPFLNTDLNSGRLQEAQALDALCSLWKLMADYANQYNNRVIIGGLGRLHEVEADRFALLAIEATRCLRLNQPQLSLRFHSKQNPKLWEAALTSIGEGCTFPMLYNDDVNVSAVVKAHQVDNILAESYLPYGCGEYVLGHHSTATPNGVINLLKALEISLNEGLDPLTGRRILFLPPISQINSMEDLWSVYARVVEKHIEATADQERLGYDVMAQEAPLAFISLLSGNCLARNKSLYGGGTDYLGGTLETYGNTNVANSLHAIDTIVFKQKLVSLETLRDALLNDFRGYENLLEQCKGVAKYGNDNPQVDDVARRVHEHVCHTTRNQAKRARLHSYLVVIINNWANAVLGQFTGASAEGRHAGAPMANANNPTPGSDTSGVIPFLNSLIKLDPSLHAGATQNMKFTKEWFGPMRTKMDALLKTYFSRGGAQAMITVVDKKDLESAMENPAEWGHLMVRVGGFSIRFIDLPRISQLEVLARTLH